MSTQQSNSENKCACTKKISSLEKQLKEVFLLLEKQSKEIFTIKKSLKR